MKCKVCNSEFSEGQVFCSYCGTKAENDIEEAVPVQTETQEQPPVPEKQPEYTPQPDEKADVMAKTGLILGIVSLATNFTCCFGSPVPCVLGIIYSAKGLKSKNRKNMAVAGLIMSIIAASISLITPTFSFNFSGVEGFEMPDFLEDLEIESASMIHLSFLK